MNLLSVPDPAVHLLTLFFLLHFLSKENGGNLTFVLLSLWADIHSVECCTAHKRFILWPCGEWLVAGLWTGSGKAVSPAIFSPAVKTMPSIQNTSFFQSLWEKRVYPFVYILSYKMSIFSRYEIT